MLMIVPVLNLVCFTTYAFCAIVTYVFVLIFLLPRLFEDKLPDKPALKTAITTFVPVGLLFILFINFWADDHGEIA